MPLRIPIWRRAGLRPVGALPHPGTLPPTESAPSDLPAAEPPVGIAGAPGRAIRRARGGRDAGGPAPGGLWRRVRAQAIVLALYVLLTLALTYPLVLHFGTHLVGRDVDEAAFVWNLWWVRHALLDLHTSPFATDVIFFPEGISLVYYTLTFLYGLLAIPLLAIFSPIVLNNLFLVGSIALSGYGSFLLGQEVLGGASTESGRWTVDREEGRSPLRLGEGPREGASPSLGTRHSASDTRPPTHGPPSVVLWWACFLAGAAYAFSSTRWVYASYGSLNLVSTAPVPFFALFLVRIVRRPSASPPRHVALAPGVGLGACLLLASYTELTFAVMLPVFGALYGAFRLGRALGRLATWRAIGPPLLAGAAVFAAGMAPYLALAAGEQAREGNYLAHGLGFADAFSADLFSFVVPTFLHPLWGAAANRLAAPFTDTNVVFLGFVTLALAATGAIGLRRRLAGWAGAAVGLGLLTLGPILHVNGIGAFPFDTLRVNFPMPYLLLQLIPYVKANRFPHRYGLVLTLCVAVLAAGGLLWLLRRLRPRATAIAAAALVGLVLFEHLAVPLPLIAAEAPLIYRTIAGEPGDFTVLELPVGWRNSYGIQGAERTLIQSYQAVHGKRLVNGNISRNPDYKFAFFQAMPVVGTLAALETGERPSPERLATDREAAAALISLLDARYLVVHEAYVDAQAREYARDLLGGEEVYADDGLIAYRLRPAPPPDQIDLGRAAAAVYLERGWTAPEPVGGRLARWIDGRPGTVFFRPPAGAAHLVLSARAFAYPGHPPQTLEALVNGRSLGHVTLADDWGAYTLDLPPAALVEGLNRLELRPASYAQPSAVLPTDLRIGGTGGRAPAELEVESAGLLGGNFARARVGERTYALDGRGYNVLALDPRSGEVRARDVFDTFASEAESARLARWVAALPEGTVVVAAVRDDAATKLTGEAVAALRSLGGAVDLRGHFRWGHALVGVKGAPPGTAVERSGAAAVRVRVGRSEDDRWLAAAVDQLGFTP